MPHIPAWRRKILARRTFSGLAVAGSFIHPPHGGVNNGEIKAATATRDNVNLGDTRRFHRLGQQQ